MKLLALSLLLILVSCGKPCNSGSGSDTEAIYSPYVESQQIDVEDIVLIDLRGGTDVENEPASIENYSISVNEVMCTGFAVFTKSSNNVHNLYMTDMVEQLTGDENEVCNSLEGSYTFIMVSKDGFKLIRL